MGIEGLGSKQYLEVKGFCMEPWILFGDRLLLDAQIEHCRLGDILVYQSSSQTEPVAHRLIQRISDREFLVSEDAEPLRKDVVAREQILGRVLSIIREGKVLSPGTRSWMYGIRKPFVFLYSYLKNPAAKAFQPVLELIQRLPAYKMLAQKIGAPQMTFFPARIREGLDRIVALRGGRYAGYLDYSVMSVEGVDTVWISNLYVRIRYRGIGLAARLLEALQKEMYGKGISQCHLACRPDLLNFYQKSGFREMDQNSKDRAFWLAQGYLMAGDLLLENKGC